VAEPLQQREADGPDGRPHRAAGWREVLAVAVVVVAIVLGAAVVTSLLPPAGQDLVLRTPLAIVVLAGGTIGLLAWLARRPPVE
jgi:heme A synthase